MMRVDFSFFDYADWYGNSWHNNIGFKNYQTFLEGKETSLLTRIGVVVACADHMIKAVALLAIETYGRQYNPAWVQHRRFEVKLYAKLTLLAVWTCFQFKTSMHMLHAARFNASLHPSSIENIPALKQMIPLLKPQDLSAILRIQTEHLGKLFTMLEEAQEEVHPVLKPIIAKHLEQFGEAIHRDGKIIALLPSTGTKRQILNKAALLDVLTLVLTEYAQQIEMHCHQNRAVLDLRSMEFAEEPFVEKLDALYTGSPDVPPKMLQELQNLAEERNVSSLRQAVFEYVSTPFCLNNPTLTVTYIQLCMRIKNYPALVEHLRCYAFAHYKMTQDISKEEFHLGEYLKGIDGLWLETLIDLLKIKDIHWGTFALTIIPLLDGNQLKHKILRNFLVNWVVKNRCVDVKTLRLYIENDIVPFELVWNIFETNRFGLPMECASALRRYAVMGRTLTNKQRCALQKVQKKHFFFPGYACPELDDSDRQLQLQIEASQGKNLKPSAFNGLFYFKKMDNNCLYAPLLKRMRFQNIHAYFYKLYAFSKGMISLSEMEIDIYANDALNYIPDITAEKQFFEHKFQGKVINTDNANEFRETILREYAVLLQRVISYPFENRPTVFACESLLMLREGLQRKQSTNPITSQAYRRQQKELSDKIEELRASLLTERQFYRHLHRLALIADQTQTNFRFYFRLEPLTLIKY